ncbi:helix-turn-helix domain-containing protein [Brevundimonas sp.]|uniref:helix-turn-helix domain-containing protein n=1 Tax=Brevundimonas sp. TaxID=1871086 RepID=UPI003F7163FE
MFDREFLERGDGDRRTNPVDVHVGGRIAYRRRSLGLSQSHLARALDLSFQQIQKYERGANRVSASKLWETAGFLGVPVGYFFEGLAQTDGATAETRGPPATRLTLSIERLAAHLGPDQQRLIRDLLRCLLPRSAAMSSRPETE